MSEKIGLDHEIGFQNKFYTKCINVIIDSIGPSIILRSILQNVRMHSENKKIVEKVDVVQRICLLCGLTITHSSFVLFLAHLSRRLKVS